jgi:DNA polymerase-4
VSYNKFLAKLASDHRKPDGLFVITPKMGPGFVEDLPVGKFHGIGPATTAKMNSHGIHTGADLRAQSLDFLCRHFGKSGAYYYWISRGVDERQVRADRVRKSVGAENTFMTDLTDIGEARAALAPIIEKVWRYCEGSGTRARTVTLKVKYADFEQITRRRTGDAPVTSQAELERFTYALLEPVFPVRLGIRLLGVTLSSIDSDKPQEQRQLTLAL